MIKDIKIIKIIIFIIILISTIIISSIIAFSLFKTKNNNAENINIDTKLPITHFLQKEELIKQDFSSLFKEDNKTKNIDSNKTIIKDDEAILKSLEDIKKQTETINYQPQPIKYDKNIFINNDREEKEKAYIEKLLYERNTPLNLNIKNNDLSDKTLKIDFGVNKLSNQDKQDKATNEHKLFRTITANKRIPAILIEPISSDKSGIITAQIEEDIYSYIGNALLIPKGSQAIGFYESNNKIGENRLNVFWREILTPQGVNILLTNSNTQDIVGKSGILGEVNNKYWDRYGLSLTLSTLANSLMLSVNNLTQKVPNANSQIVLNNANSNLEQIMNNIINEQIKIRPTIEVQAGSRIFIRPTTHIFFPIPKEKEILAQYFNNYLTTTLNEESNL